MPPIDTIHTYAKINLILQVAPPITDPSDPNCGMHPICSWMHAIDLSDEITIEQTPGNQSTFDIHWEWGRHPVEWDTKSDLIVRAHALLESESGRPLPVKITASKSIPAGGGLGGGSSNAAGVLMGLNDLFDLGYNEQQLQSVALKLGSDIPFFIDISSYRVGIPPKPAVVSGFGEQIERTPRLDDSFYIFVPKFGCSTAEVYKALDALGSTRVLDPERVLKAATLMKIDPSELINDLTEPAMIVQPELRTIFARFRDVQVEARLSGSGSSIFIFQSQGGAKKSGWLSAVQPHEFVQDKLGFQAASLS